MGTVSVGGKGRKQYCAEEESGSSCSFNRVAVSLRSCEVLLLKVFMKTNISDIRQHHVHLSHWFVGPTASLQNEASGEHHRAKHPCQGFLQPSSVSSPGIPFIPLNSVVTLPQFSQKILLLCMKSFIIGIVFSRIFL